MALLAVAKQDHQNQQRYGTPDCDIFYDILHHGCHSAGLVTAAQMMITMAAAVNASQGRPAGRWRANERPPPTERPIAVMMVVVDGDRRSGGPLRYLRNGCAAAAGGALDCRPGLPGGQHAGDSSVALGILRPAFVLAFQLRLGLPLRLPAAVVLILARRAQ